MAVNYFNGGGVVQIPTRSSVIKSTRSCCLDKNAAIKYQDQLKNDVQSSHHNYMKIEQENSYLNSHIGNLDESLKDQNYQIACLKYELEQLTRQNCDLQSKLSDNKVQIIEQSQVTQSSSSKINSVSQTKLAKNPKILAAESTDHFFDTRKLPEIVCVCGVHFKTHQNLKEHVKYHCNKANFSCQICGLQKHGLNLLKHHMKIQHNITEFTSLKGCRKCGKLFNNLERLHAHRRREQ